MSRVTRGFTGASLIENGTTGSLVDRLPPGRSCIENESDESALKSYRNALDRAMSMRHNEVRARATQIYRTDQIVGDIIESLDGLRIANDAGVMMPFDG